MKYLAILAALLLPIHAFALGEDVEEVSWPQRLPAISMLFMGKVGGSAVSLNNTTFVLMDLDMTEESDPNAQFSFRTGDLDEVCFDGTQTISDALIRFTGTSARDATASTALLSFTLGLDNAAAVGNGDEVGALVSNTYSASEVGGFVAEWTLDILPGDCIGLLGLEASSNAAAISAGTLTVSGPISTAAADLLGGAATRTECKTFNASAMDCKTTNGCATAVVTGTNFNFALRDFDTASDESGSFTFGLPKNLVGTTFEARYAWQAATITGGSADDVCFFVESASFGDGDAWTTGGLGTAAGIDDTGVTANDIQFSEAFTVTHGWTAGERAVVKLTRDVDGGLAACDDDNVGVDARIHSLEVCYEANSPWSGE